MKFTSTPVLSEFDPTVIPHQFEVIKDVRRNFNYEKLGLHEVLLSGAVGSAKTILMAHLAITHCLLYPGAHVGIGRRAMPQLRDTIWDVIMKHLVGQIKMEQVNALRCNMTFPNGSKITSHTWADRHYQKFRSFEFSAFFIEELTENPEREFYDEIRMRVGRLNHVPERLLMSATNPDDPTFWGYDYFINSKRENVRVYYSKTDDNPFLPKTYKDQLASSLDPKMARRMLYGEWLSIRQSAVYYAYEKQHNFRDQEYKVDPNHPVHMSFDFNIGEGKPLSACFFQYINDEFHFFDEVVVDGMRTEDALEEAYGRKLLDFPTYVINGDATGKHRDTRSRHSDWDIIKKFLSNTHNTKGQPIQFKIDVPLSNPKVRDRHNTVNAYCQNSKGQRRLFVYRKAKTVDEGLRLTKLRAGADYVEDDSIRSQHISTALGYGIIATVRKSQELQITSHRR